MLSLDGEYEDKMAPPQRRQRLHRAHFAEHDALDEAHYRPGPRAPAVAAV
jgi:hypothetical protein